MGKSDPFDELRSVYTKEKLRVLRDKLEDSAVFLALFFTGKDFDVKQMIELGGAVVLDKPILLVAPENQKLPDNIVRLAHRIERYKGEEDITLAVDRLLTWATSQDIIRKGT